MRPNFIFIGPDKSGSSWLHTILRQHPECFVPPSKDIYFFDRYYHRGFGWYLHHFRQANAGHKAIGELSHDYLFSPEAARRIRQDLPGVRLLTSLRQPIDRSFSQYLFMVRNGVTKAPFEQAIDEFPSLLGNSFYGRHLKAYFEIFDHSRIKVLFFESLQRDPRGFGREVFDFLGLRMIESLPFETKVLAASRPRSETLAHLTHVAAVQARHLGLGRLVGRLKQGPLRAVLYRPYEAKERPSISAKTWAKLGAVFEPDIVHLEGLLGHSLDAWRHPPEGLLR